MRMKIVFLGARGIPARYGGFDTFVEELSKRRIVCLNSNVKALGYVTQSTDFLGRP